MFRKSVVLMIIASLCWWTLMWPVNSNAQAWTMYHVYNYARVWPLYNLRSFLQNNELLELEDHYNNTALCYAILNQDKMTAQKLIVLGADLNAWCMSRFSVDQLREFGLTQRGTRSASAYLPYRRYSSSSSSVITRKNLFGLGLIGGIAGSVALIVALVGGGGGGSKGNAVNNGGNNSGGNEEPTDKTVLAETKTIPAVTYCPEGMSLINGVCTKAITVDADGKTPIVVENPEKSPHYLAEFGGKIVNVDGLSYVGTETEPVIAMQANGVSASALKDKTVYLSGASSVTNQSTGTIQMLEISPNDKGLIALYGTSAGTINNDGTIDIISKSHAESAALKVDRNDAANISGIGANVNNKGTIHVTDQGDGMGVLSAISAPGRSVTNEGTIGIFLDTNGGVIDEKAKGSAMGIYGRSISNQGTISLSTNATGAATAINTEAYLLRGYGDSGSVVANDGTLNIDLTNIAWGIYGVWSDEAAEEGSTVKNTGNINVVGALYNDNLTRAKKVYLLGAEGGVSTIDNSGLINVGTASAPIDVSRGGIIDAVYGFSGTMNNTNKINFNLTADPLFSSDSFSALAMSLNKGIIINDADINYLFSNEKENFTGHSNQYINLTAINTLSATVTNNANLTANLRGSAAEKTEYMDSSFIAMDSTDGNMTNNGLISVNSNMDNVDLAAMGTLSGSVYNAKDARITLKTTGYNANLSGTAEGEGKAGNDGYVYLVHNGGSGDIVGFDGGNKGLIQIEANNMSGTSRITGGASVPGQAAESLENSDVENTADAGGIVNIFLTGKTSGEVYGHEYGQDATKGGASGLSANTINITAKDSLRVGDLSVFGITVDTYGRSKKYTGIVSVQRAGTMTLNVMGNPNYSTRVVGLSGGDAHITNTESSVVNLNVDLNNSKSHFIAGMEDVDYTIKYDEEKEKMVASMDNEFKLWNDGTLNLNISGEGANVLYDSKIPFDVVGMVTNSYALNTGTININVDSLTAKTAGMVAYDGGAIENRGTISFDGNADNFVPMYATGNRTYTEETKTDPDDEGKYTKRIMTKDFYATIRNSGRIIVKNNTSNLQPQGKGYYSASGDPWAQEIKNEVYDCTAEGCVLNTEKSKTEDNRGKFTEFDTITPPVIDDPGDPDPDEPFDVNTTNDTSDSSSLVAKAPVSRMRINQGVRYVTELGGSFVADGVHLLGDVTAGTSLVQGHNANVYVASGDGYGSLVGDGDFSDLGLSSNSAMFQASYAPNAANSNGIDIVMKRKSFYEFLQNASLAGYLEKNYMNGNNVKFFDKLKSFEKMNHLTNALDRLTGKGVLSRFNFEDITMMKELNYNMNEKIFTNQEDMLSVTDSVKSLAFKGDAGSQAKYSLMFKKHGNYSMGLGVSFAKMRSDDANDANERQGMMYQMVLPIGYKKFGFNLLTSPQIGYARDSYKRVGFDQMNYKGHIEKRVFGLTNEIRYPISFGSWTLEPVSEFNILGYNQRGREDKKEYSLNIKSQNTYSVEGGLGAYLTRTTQPSKNGTLKLSSGVVVYHEFADPYKLDVGMMGLDGHFTLRDEDRSQNRAVLRAGFDYTQENLSLYGALTSYVDDEVKTNVKSGVNWKF